MKRFKTISECIKCGRDGSGHQMHHGMVFDGARNVIVRHCWGCGYEWDEAPLDTPEPAAERGVRGFWRWLVYSIGVSEP